MKEGEDNADMALAKRLVVITKKLFKMDMLGLRDWTSDDCDGISVVEGTGLKRAPYRGRKIVQRPAFDLAN